MTDKLRVFVSSVQKELEDSRASVQNLINTDPFLSAHCVPVLYECEPASPYKAAEECLKTLDSCQVYLLMVYQQYGPLAGELSLTHAEYRRARANGLPVLAFIRGERNVPREERTRAFLKEVEGDGSKYKRFANVVDLQKEVRAALVKLLAEVLGVAPTKDEDTVAAQTIQATSPFESQRLTFVRWEQLDHEVLGRLVAAAEGMAASTLTTDQLLASALTRGLVWCETGSGKHFATAAGIVLLAPDPSAPLPQCRILADAYHSTERDRDPSDQEDIRAPMPLAIDRAIAFIGRNTRHPMRIVGLNRVRLDEYPVDALREALVNAASHRQYEDAGRKIIVEVFTDHISVLSPGLPPSPITIAKLRSGNYRACSRNPVLAQCLSYFHRIEERGSGFRRMHDQMLDHGLEPPTLGEDTGYFEVRFPGPGENVERLKVPDGSLKVTPSIEAQLNDRQRKMMLSLLEGRELTSRECEREFGVSRPVLAADFGKLTKLGLAVQVGKGRSTRYRLSD